MKKIIRIKESELVHLIKKFLNEDINTKKEKSLIKEYYNFTKNLSIGSKGQEVQELQELLKSLGYNLGTSGIYGDGIDGSFGGKTSTAVSKYQAYKGLKQTGVFTPSLGKSLISDFNKGLKPGKTTDTKKVVSTDKTNTNTKTEPNINGFILVFAFPDYEPSAGDSWFNRNIAAPISRQYFGTSGNEGQSHGGSSSGGKGGGKQIKMGKAGHGGCIIIKMDGTAKLFEFGRYDSKLEEEGKGITISKNLGKIAIVKNGKLLNAQQVAKNAKLKTQGSGPRLAMDVAVLPLTNVDGSLKYAEVDGPQDYALLDPMSGGAKNCGTFALEAAQNGGVKVSFRCFASPIDVVKHVSPQSTETFTV